MHIDSSHLGLPPWWLYELPSQEIPEDSQKSWLCTSSLASLGGNFLGNPEGIRIICSPLVLIAGNRGRGDHGGGLPSLRFAGLHKPGQARLSARAGLAGCGLASLRLLAGLAGWLAGLAAGWLASVWLASLRLLLDLA